MTFLTSRAPILVAALFSLLLSAFAAMPAAAQTQELSPESLALARKYVDLTDNGAIYETTVVQAGIKTYQRLLPQDPSIAEPLNAAIETVLTFYRGKKGELFDQIARIYAIAFSREELQQIVDFYGSPTGQKLAKANASLNPDIQKIMAIFSTNLNTEFFAKVRAELKSKGIDT